VEGYEVVANDDRKVGEVVGVAGDTLIVQHGTLFKHRVGLPRELVSVDDEARVVRATVSKEVLDEAPEVDGDSFDARQVAEYYGLARGSEAPDTLGYGDVAPDEAGRSAEDDARRLGLETDEEERLRTRTGLSAGEGPLDRGVSSGATGGDRFRDAPQDDR
jgi:hypothetical protein